MLGGCKTCWGGARMKLGGCAPPRTPPENPPVPAAQGQKEIATNFMYSLMYSLLKIAVLRFLGKIIVIFFCPCCGGIIFYSIHAKNIKNFHLSVF